MDQLIRYFAPEFIGWTQTEAAEQNWAHANSLLCLDKHWILLPAHDITYPCKTSCFESPFSHKKNPEKAEISTITASSLFHPHDRRSVPLLGVGNDEASSLPCKRDFFSQLVKHALKSKKFFYFRRGHACLHHLNLSWCCFHSCGWGLEHINMLVKNKEEATVFWDWVSQRTTSALFLLLFVVTEYNQPLG